MSYPSMTNLTPFVVGDTVRIAPAVVARTGGTFRNARGVVVAVGRSVVAVDFQGTYIPHEDGSTVRHFPAANLRSA